jgi:hypothetical protein
MTTLEAWQAFAAKSRQAAAAWQQRLNGINEAAVWQVIAEVPPHRMTSITREFTVRLLLENQRRVLAGADG